MAGVISAYHPEYEVKEGALAGIDNTNSGIIVAYTIESALELIKSNPAGKDLN